MRGRLLGAAPLLPVVVLAKKRPATLNQHRRHSVMYKLQLQNHLYPVGKQNPNQHRIRPIKVTHIHQVKQAYLEMAKRVNNELISKAMHILLPMAYQVNQANNPDIHASREPADFLDHRDNLPVLRVIQTSKEDYRGHQGHRVMVPAALATRSNRAECQVHLATQLIHSNKEGIPTSRVLVI